MECPKVSWDSGMERTVVHTCICRGTGGHPMECPVGLWDGMDNPMRPWDGMDILQHIWITLCQNECVGIGVATRPQQYLTNLGMIGPDLINIILSTGLGTLLVDTNFENSAIHQLCLH